MRKLIVSIVIVVAVVAGGWYFFTNVVNSASPEKLLQKMQENMAEVKSGKFNAHLVLEGSFASDLLPTKELTSMMGGGGLDESGDTAKEMKQGKTIIDAEGGFEKIENDVSKGSVEIALSYESGEDTGSLSLSTRMLEDMTYIKLSNVNLQAPEDVKPLLDSISSAASNKWIGLEKKDDAVSPEGQTIAVQGEKKDVQEFEDLLEEESLFILEQKTSKETIRGVNTVHVRAKFNKDALTRVLLNKEKKLRDDEIVKKQEMIEQLTRLDIGLWVGEKDALLYKISIAGPVKSEAEGIDATVDANIELYDHNKPVNVMAPDSFSSFEEVMQQVVGAMLFGAFGSLNTMMDTSDNAALGDSMTFDFGSLEDLDGTVLPQDGMEENLDAINFGN